MIKKILGAFIILAILIAFFNRTAIISNFKGENQYRKEKKSKSDKPEGYQQYYQLITTRIGDNTNGYEIGYRISEFKKHYQASMRLKSTKETLPWISRGPYNVAGRVRGIIIDPDDATVSTWFVGAVSGGIWKTTDKGATWVSLTNSWPNLSISWLTMAPSNHQVIYAGTGEGYGGYGMVTGDGIFKSTNKGESWDQLTSTSKNINFSHVNRIIVDPANENILLACTNKGIFKSIDGGTSWGQKYGGSRSVQDLDYDPSDFNTIYATVNSLGVIKSENAGETWNLSSTGMSSNCNRVEICISPVNNNYLYASVEADNSKTHVYISTDKGQNWNIFKSLNSDDPVDFLGAMGWYCNIIAPHPYDVNTVFVGGVYLGKVTFGSQFENGIPGVIRVDTSGTAPFLSFINFGGSFLDGGLQTGDNNNAKELVPSDWSSVEIRFGNGLKQMAHRFTVPDTSGTNKDGGAGVADSLYEYKDYIEVPFQAWDTKNNRQLMVSFRDQERDGKFNLIQRPVSNSVDGREYVFINAVAYNNTADINIAKKGGHSYKQLYFFWPTLAANGTWNENVLPDSKINIQYGPLKYQTGRSTLISDPYGTWEVKNKNLHVDHHNLLMIPKDQATGLFYILNGNDGGIGYSENKGDSWQQLAKGMITTQFYGVSKKPGVQEYIGGTQDNGTWQSPSGREVTDTSTYTQQLGGDGFDVVWHPTNPNQIIASMYNNRFYYSSNYGQSWIKADKGINEDGPFVTRIGYSPQRPDNLFAIGYNGVYKSTKFGFHKIDSWSLVSITAAGWTLDSNIGAGKIAVSLANPDIVWAGYGMNKSPFLTLFLSKDGGTSFSPVTPYDDQAMGYLSGFATHPVNPKEAFALFSFRGAPKILRTLDYGKTWVDISGFNLNSTSNNGFPDVEINTLLVMPFDTTWIWAGTEIGLFESKDNGVSWHYADNGLPAVSVWQMRTIDNEVVVATHGRGIWTTQIPGSGLGVSVDNPKKETGFELAPNPANQSIRINFTNSIKSGLSFKIYNLSGSIVYESYEHYAAGAFSKVISTANFANGTYLMVFQNGKSLSIKKFIVQH